MKARPILFSGAMVRAMLDRRKTQTRRIVKPQPHHGPIGTMVDLGDGEWALDDGDLSGLWKCPYGVPGDLLWPREAWSQPNDQVVIYRANWREDAKARGFDNIPADDSAIRWRPGIHMPRWANRLTLEITDVRVERLQDISADDADAEGFGGEFPDNVMPDVFPARDGGWGHLSMPECYGVLWEHINGPGSWATNPWVWAVTFEVHKQNIDAFLKAREAA